MIGPLLFALFCGAAGFNLAALQYNLHQPAYVTAPSEVKITAEIFDIDGWASDRSRLWVTIIKTDSDRLQLTNARVRVTSKTVPTSATIGAVIEMRVRLFPPPRRILPGTTDFGRNARVADIVASGFVTSSSRRSSSRMALGPVTSNKAPSAHAGCLARWAASLAQNQTWSRNSSVHMMWK